MDRRFSNKEIIAAAAGVLLLVVLAFWVGWVWREYYDPKPVSVHEVSSKYKFVSPLLFVKTPEEDSFPKYLSLKQAITDYADKMEDTGKATDVSIYFRDLDSSQWVAAHVEKRFAPASMFKVITLIAVLRKVESDPALLETHVTLPAADKLPPYDQEAYTPANPLQPGHTYTVEELIDHLVIDSDNLADYGLRYILGSDELQKMYDDLELPPVEGGYTTQEYSRLFRTIYNSTYISPRLSERVLELLSKTNFTEGLVQGVPEGTVVSHKFGERTATDEQDNVSNELHDCGIIYYPNDPYFLCVMTRGVDFKDLELVLKGASELVWQEFSRLH